MRTIGAAVDAHILTGETSLATFVRFQLRDGSFRTLTSHDQDITIDGLTYLSSVGYNPTGFTDRAEMAPNTLDLEGVLASIGLDRSEIVAGLWDDADYFIFETNFKSPVLDEIKQASGKVGGIQTVDDRFITELQRLNRPLNQETGDRISKRCRDVLGGPRCLLSLAPFRVHSTLTGVTDTRNFADTARTEADGFFEQARFRFTTGLNAGINGVITDATNANPVVITSVGHGLTTEMKTYLDEFTGDYVALNGTLIDTNLFSVTVIDDDTFSIPVDGTSFAAYAANGGRFSFGMIRGVKKFTQTGGLIEIDRPMPFTVANGDRYTTHRGCDRLANTCITVFLNMINFDGENDVPAEDEVRDFTF